ncbi:MAG: hypothetical protein ACRD4P_06525 [Bryobacteraceae bacterium]
MPGAENGRDTRLRGGVNAGTDASDAGVSAQWPKQSGADDQPGFPSFPAPPFLQQQLRLQQLIAEGREVSDAKTGASDDTLTNSAIIVAAASLRAADLQSMAL